MDADNILNEFHKHMEQRNEDKEQLDDVQNDILFDYNEMLPDGIVYDDHRIFPDLESNMNLNNQDYDIIVEELDIITPTIDSGRPSKLNSTTAYQSEPPVTAKKTKINSDDLTNAVDKYVNQMFEEDITASLKSLEKKYKREQVDDGGLCEQCGLSFTNSNEYKKHIRSHDDKGMCMWFLYFFSFFFNFNKKFVSLLLQPRRHSNSNANTVQKALIINKLTTFITILIRTK